MDGYLRCVQKEDIDLLFKWTNEPTVRRNFFSMDKIPYEEYKKWFEKLLTRKDMKQYVYVYDDEPIGEVRIHIHGDEAEIGYSVCAEKRGMGHGKNLLQLLYNQVQVDFPEVKKLVAKVKPDNIASQRAFLDMGYTEIYEAFEIAVDRQMEYSENIVRGGVLYLTNNRGTLAMYDWLNEREQVNLYSGRLTVEQIKEIKPQLIISYNYKYIIENDVIECMKGNIINLHISYLPWNKGADPNIWSFLDDTPKGVTIHQINSGLDTGKIMYQRECFFDIEKETFISTYDKLQQTIMELFKENWEEIKAGNYPLKEQQGIGSYHAKKNLAELQSKIAFRWSDNIADFLRRYQRLEEKF